jgi:hypothetical protein
VTVPPTGPRAEEVAEALRGGTPPSALTGDAARDRQASAPTPAPAALDDRRVEAGGVSVRTRGAALLAARDDALAALRRDGVGPALAAKDATLWGADAAPEASVRLGWLDLPTSSRALLPRLAALRDELVAEGLDRVVLAGMGGSSLAPEVITRTAGVDLVVLDSTDPGQVRAALTDLERTVVVVSSKSGGTVEPDSSRRAFAAAFAEAGLSEREAARRFVAVTDPGTSLAGLAEDSGFRALFLADPDVGGRYSALSAFGLVPSTLAGVDCTDLLDAAERLLPSLASDDDNPGLVLGAALAGGGVSGRDKVLVATAEDAGAPAGFADWVEQLVAESTGKSGRGLLPVPLESPDAPGSEPQADSHLVVVGGADVATDAAAGPLTGTSGPLGASFLLWEYAVAVAGRVLRVDPFDQPDVTESKDNTAALLDAGLPDPEPPVLVDGPVQVRADPGLLGGVADLAGALEALLAVVPPRGYLAVMAYLDRTADAAAERLRALLARRLAHPVTFGWGPRLLHSTGQLHKGGPQVGAFLQITGAVAQDLAVPGRDYSFATLHAAQALGDARALGDRGRPLVRVHLTDRPAGLARLLEAAAPGRTAP